MKKFMKGCGIAALVLIAVGLSLGLAGRSMAGQDTIRDVVQDVTDGRVRMNGNNWWGWNISLGRHLADFEIASSAALDVVEGTCNKPDKIVQELAIEDWGYESTWQEQEGVWIESDDYKSDDEIFDDDYSILKGDVEKYKLGTDFYELDIEIGGGNFYTAESDDENFYVEVYSARKFQSFVEDGTLYIKLVSDVRRDQSQVILYVPENFNFEDAEIEVGMGTVSYSGLNAHEASLEVGSGSIWLEGLKVQELDASVGAGAIDIEDMIVSNLDVEVGVGAFWASGTASGNVDVECAMGSVEIGLSGSEQDFNYYLENAMGYIDIGNTGNMANYGVSQERTINNGAMKDMEIECAMGNVSVWFTD
ncbi:MAG: DUF4097 domain-containing protein [Lachnospiraceae bacterium]|nr:DUF4097 domain-containing protein [Lachnospiraceae bacterium]